MTAADAQPLDPSLEQPSLGPSPWKMPCVWAAIGMHFISGVMTVLGMTGFLSTKWMYVAMWGVTEIGAIAAVLFPGAWRVRVGPSLYRQVTPPPLPPELGAPK